MIKNSKKFGIAYFAESSSKIDNDHGPESVFDNIEKPYFHSDDSSNQWWQVVFSSPILIKSYFIKTSKNLGCRPKSWTAKSSFDGKSWKKVDEKSGVETGGNTKSFDLSSPTACKMFRLSFSQTSCGNYIAFTHFDCFGGLADSKTREGYMNTQKRILHFIIHYSYLIFIGS